MHPDAFTNATYEPQPTTTPMVQQQASNVGVQIEGLHKDVHALCERLSPVLRPDSPHALGNDVGPDRDPFSPLASDLEGHAGQLAAIRRVIEGVLQRLEV